MLCHVTPRFGEDGDMHKEVFRFGGRASCYPFPGGVGDPRAKDTTFTKEYKTAQLRGASMNTEQRRGRGDEILCSAIYSFGRVSPWIIGHFLVL